MIKTLRITTIFVAVLAAVFFVSIAIFGFRSDPEIERFLNTPSAVEKFRQAKGTERAKESSRVSPLVKQAESFAKIINPPPKPQRTPTIKQPVERKPPAISVKFDLIGTSVYESDPKKSLALIDQPGKGLRWVRQSSNVGHLVLEQINDGLVVVRDGQRTFELTPKREQRRSLLKGQNSDKTGSIPTKPWDSKPSLPPLGGTRAGISNAKITSAPAMPTPEEQAEILKQQIVMEKLFKDMGDISEKSQSSDMSDSEFEEAQEKAGALLLEKLISELQATHVSSEEADKLGDLGKELEQAPEQLSDPDKADEEKLTEPAHPTKARSRPAPKKDETRDAQQRKTEMDARKRRLLRRLKK